MEKLFSIKKTFKAKSAADAIRIEKRHPVDEVWVDPEWSKQQDYRDEKKKNIGFKK